MDLTYLDTQITNLQNQVVVLTTQIATPKPGQTTYTVTNSLGSKTYDWNGYRAAIVTEIDGINGLIEKLVQLKNRFRPWIVNTVHY
jgi:hypothetical protein